MLLTRGGDDPWAKLSLALGTSILSGGVVAGVLQALKHADIFRESLRDVLGEDASGEHIRRAVASALTSAENGGLFHRAIERAFLPIATPHEIDQHWNRITARLFQAHFPSLPGELSAIQASKLIGLADYYFTEHSRTIRLSWEDRDHGLVRYEDSLYAVIQTTSRPTGSEVLFNVRYRPDDVSSTIAMKECKFGDVNVPINDFILRPDGSHEFSFPLSPNSRVTHRRKTTKIYDIATEPFCNYRSVRLVEKPRLYVESRATDLCFAFSEIGDVEFTEDNAHEPGIRGCRKHLSALVHGLFLPGQGYMVVLIDQRCKV